VQKNTCTGLFVSCRPYPEDPGVVEQRERAVCLHRPYPGCPYCPHAVFTLYFPERPRRYDLVACPRWVSPTERVKDVDPNYYKHVELALCESKPFEFCCSCPSIQKVQSVGADKYAEGWYGRWRRYNKERFKDG
jgi:hypothetical protein